MNGTRMHMPAPQGGQALAEGLLGLAALAVVFWAVPVIGRYQDIALQAVHASSYAAFLRTRHPFEDTVLAGLVGRYYFSEAGARWRTRSGGPLLAASPSLQTHRTGMAQPAPAPATPSGIVPAQAIPLFREWHVGDEGMLRAAVTVPARRVFPAFETRGAGSGRLALHRSTSILTGAGHAFGDEDVQQRVAQGDMAWRRAALRSEAAGQVVASRLRSVDQAWGRAQPTFDWLSAWRGLVPSDRLGARP